MESRAEDIWREIQELDYESDLKIGIFPDDEENKDMIDKDGDAVIGSPMPSIYVPVYMDIRRKESDYDTYLDVSLDVAKILSQLDYYTYIDIKEDNDYHLIVIDKPIEEYNKIRESNDEMQLPPDQLVLLTKPSKNRLLNENIVSENI